MVRWAQEARRAEERILPGPPLRAGSGWPHPPPDPMPDADPHALDDLPCRYNEAVAQTEQLRRMRDGTALACAQAARRWLSNTVYSDEHDQLAAELGCFTKSQLDLL